MTELLFREHFNRVNYEKTYMYPALFCSFLLCLFSMLFETKLKDKFYTSSLPRLLDSLSKETKVAIVFDRKDLDAYQITDHFFSETLGSVMHRLCKENHLYYLAESQGPVFVMKRLHDISRLKKVYERGLLKQETFEAIMVTVKSAPLPIEKVVNLFLNLTGKVTTGKVTY